VTALNDLQKAFLKNILVSKDGIIDPATGAPLDWAALSSGQPLDSDLTAIAALTPANDDVIQRKSGAWTNRTIAQLVSDLGLASTYQPLDSDLTSIAALATTTFGRSILALAAGSSGMVPVSNGTVQAMAFPPGYELGYAEATGQTSITATSAATSQTVLTAPSVTCDGVQSIWVEIFTQSLKNGGGSGSGAFLELFDGSTDLTLLAWVNSDGSATGGPILVRRKLTPSAGAHVFTARVWRQVANGNFGGGSSGSEKSYIRVSAA
jgi:hypothetical protein